MDCYEGNWQSMPDFELLKPAKIRSGQKFQFGFPNAGPLRWVAVQGIFRCPQDGRYTFRTRSDDGTLLFIGDPPVTITKLETCSVPLATPAIIGEPMAGTVGQQWVSVEGRVNFVSPSGKGLELKLRSEHESIRVRIADSAGMDATRLMNLRVRITGAGSGIFNLDRRIVLGDLFAANAMALEYLDRVADGPEWTSPLVSARQVQSLPQEHAKLALPVHLHGVVTSMGPRL